MKLKVKKKKIIKLIHKEISICFNCKSKCGLKRIKNQIIHCSDYDPIHKTPIRHSISARFKHPTPNYSDGAINLDKQHRRINDLEHTVNQISFIRKFGKPILKEVKKNAALLL